MTTAPRFRKTVVLAFAYALTVSLLATPGTAADTSAERLPPAVAVAGYYRPDKVVPKGVEAEPLPAPVPTTTWAVQLAPAANADSVADDLGFANRGQIGALDGYYLFEKLVDARSTPGFEADPLQVTAIEAELAVAGDIVWFEQQTGRIYELKAPTDPLYGDQWHLSNTGQSGGTAGEDANTAPAWAAGYDGSGVTIAIVDDGLQHSHSDFAAKYAAVSSYDIVDDDADPSPVGVNDNHGTAVGGVAAADDDGATCGVGAAYGAAISGIRLPGSWPISDAMIAGGLSYGYQSNDIYNNSWGPPDGVFWLDGPGPLTTAALVEGVTNGRGGLGNVYVWAGGNGQGSEDNVNYDGFANSRHTIAVGASDHNGVQSSYSEPGAALLVNASSKGPAGSGITTTDRSGLDGYTTTDCADDFGGTSSASPLAAGVVGLMLDANPALGWRDVQHILVNTAEQNDAADSDWVANGAGHLVNHKYGFGRIDAAAATAAADGWASVGAATSVTTGTIAVGVGIPDNPTPNPGVSSVANVTDDITLEHVEVVFNATHTYRGDLRVVLESPSGTTSLLAEQHGDSGDHYADWTFMSTRHWDESATGDWTLRVYDDDSLVAGTFDSWELVLHGTAPAVAGPLMDGGFEEGTPNPYWVEYSQIFSTPLCSVATCGTAGLPDGGPHSGDWWAWFGGSAAEESSSVSQSFVVGPVDTTLSFFLRIPHAAGNSALFVTIESGTGVDVLFGVDEEDLGLFDDWTEIQLDISAYAGGGEHTLTFAQWNDPGETSNYWVDDVSISAATTGTVTGVVRHAGAPLAGVEVWLGYAARHTCTAGDGSFTFTDVPVGETLVAATGPAVGLPCSNPDFVNGLGQPLAAQFWDHKTANEPWDEFSLTPGEVKVIDFDAVLRQPPVAVADTAAVEHGGTVAIDVLSNDQNPEGAAVEIIKTSDPAHGTATLDTATGRFVYTHDGSNTTADSFTYKLDDSIQESAPATVTVAISAPPYVEPTVGLQDPTTGQWHLRDAAGSVMTFYFGDPGDSAFMGDWNCDGIDTPGLFRVSDAYAYLRNSNTQGVADIRFFFGDPSDVPLAGDFNGNGCDTLSIYRPSTQTFFIMNRLGENEGGLGAAEYSFGFGNPGDKPVVGDWDGDGIDEIGLHRESTGFFYYRNTLDTGIANGQFYFGDPGDRFVAGDFGSVDGADTPGLFRPGNTTFYYRHTMTAGNADSSLAWGSSSFMPLAGNFE